MRRLAARHRTPLERAGTWNARGDDQFAEQSHRLGGGARGPGGDSRALPQAWHLDHRRRRLRAAVLCGRQLRAVLPRSRQRHRSRGEHQQLFQGVADDRLAAGLDHRSAGADARSRQAHRIQHLLRARVRAARGRDRNHRGRTDRAAYPRALSCRARFSGRATDGPRRHRSRVAAGRDVRLLPRRRRDRQLRILQAARA